MVDYAALKKKVEELAARQWDVAGIQARVRKMMKNGIPRKKLNPQELLAKREEILDRVQRRAEEYNFVLKNCARSTALALMEEFGQGNMEIIKALAPFPGIGGTGRICGGVTGSLINFGLFFSGDDLLELGYMSDPRRSPIQIAQKFLAKFEETLGHIYCADIIEKVTIGFKLNPGEGEYAMKTFTAEKGFEKCGLPPGISARLAAGLILDSMQ